MKIAFFTDTYFPQLNGVTISVSNYAKELRKKGHTVYIFAPKIKGYIDREKDVYRLPSLKILSSEPEVHLPIGVSYKGLFTLLRMDFDIIHAHGNGPFSLLGYEVARAEGIPFVMTFHTLHNEYTHYFFDGKIVRPGMVKRALRFLAERCDGVIAPSEKMKAKLLEFGYEGKSVVIPNFVELSQFDEKQKGYLHKKLHLSQRIPLLVSVGRVGKEKNFLFLVDMFAELAKKDKTSHLVIIGQGPQKSFLQKHAQDLHIADRVHFTGRISSQHMPKVYADATIFVFASTTEVHPMVVLEAAAAGVPMVVVDDLAFAQVAVPNKNAFVSELDTHVFAGKVRKLLADKALQESFHKNAKTIIAQHFQGEQLAEQLLAFYKEMYVKYRLHGKILRHMNRVAARGVRGIQKTRRLTSHMLFKLVSSR